MKVLAIDTSAKTATVALVDNGAVLAEYSIFTNTHSTTLLPMIESLMKHSGITAVDIDLYSVSVGPGSFTGIRIGVSTVKGLAFVNETPCVGVSSLEAMAQNFAGIDCIVAPVIDARRDMVYTAIYKSYADGRVEQLLDDCQIAIDELIEKLKQYPGETVYISGDAYAKVVSNENAPGNIATTPEKLRGQSAAGVAYAGIKKWESTEDKSEFTDASVMPVYLKKSQAERERDERIAAQAQ